jgi:hypothetical protein
VTGVQTCALPISSIMGLSADFCCGSSKVLSKIFLKKFIFILILLPA